MAQRKQEQDVPPGWSYNPSDWPQRLPIVGLALVGTAVAVYLTLYQLRVLPGVWEPFFGDRSRTILNSKVSRVLPVPDAALGALGYLVDAVTGVVGGALAPAGGAIFNSLAAGETIAMNRT